LWLQIYHLVGELGYGPYFTFNSAPKQTIEQYDFTAGTATTETKEVSYKVFHTHKPSKTN
jgi:hypothetical protein